MYDSGHGMQQHREKMLLQKDQRKRDQQLPPRFRTAFHGQAKLDDLAGNAPVLEPQAKATQNIELRMQHHLEQLKNIRAVEKKIEMKAQWLPEYQGFIDASLAQSPAPQNTVLMYLMVWAIDCQQFALAANIGQYALLNSMVMPEGFTRNVAEVLAEQIGEACSKDQALAQKHATLLTDIAEMIHGEDVVQQAHAKIYKAIGIALEVNQPREALTAYQTALRLDDKSGVKGFINALEKQLSRSTTESSHDKPSGSQASTDSSDTTPASTAPSDDANQSANTDTSVDTGSDVGSATNASSGE